MGKLRKEDAIRLQLKMAKKHGQVKEKLQVRRPNK